MRVLNRQWVEPLKWVNLTKEQKCKVANGCGGKGGWLQPPNFFFKADCDRHDFSYWVGHTEPDRVRADLGFYLAMIEDVKRLQWWRRPYARPLAWTYYNAVRLFGKRFFYYGATERDWKDLADLK